MKTSKQNEKPEEAADKPSKLASEELDEIRKLIRRTKLENRVLKQLSEELISTLNMKTKTRPAK
jgi:hypothetical protein